MGRLAGDSGGALDRPVEELALGHGLVDDRGGHGVRAPVAATCDHCLLGGSQGKLAGDQCGHTPRERDPQVHLRQAEEAPILAHDPLVAGQRQHGARIECVSVDRRDGERGKGQDPGKEAVDPCEALLPLRVLGLRHPLQIEAIGEELALPGKNEGRWSALRALDLVERSENRVEIVRVKSVLARAHPDDGHDVRALDGDALRKRFAHAGTPSPLVAGTFSFPEPSCSRSALAASRSWSKRTTWPAAPQFPSGTSWIRVQTRTPAPSPHPVASRTTLVTSSTSPALRRSLSAPLGTVMSTTAWGSATPSGVWIDSAGNACTWVHVIERKNSVSGAPSQCSSVAPSSRANSCWA